MSRKIKIAISTALIALVMVCALPVANLMGVDMPEIFVTKAKAYTSGDYTYTVSNGEATITKVNTSINGEVSIPSRLDGYNVTKIGDTAFFDCSELTSVSISKKIESIGFAVFNNCPKLKSITVSSDNWHYSSDQYGILYNKDKTELIRYPAGKTETSYVIPDDVKTISSVAFQDCKYLKNITLPSSVTNIKDRAFKGCTGLTSVTMSYGVTHIGSSAFSGCTGLTRIIIPQSVTNIEYYAFNGCTGLKELTMPVSTQIDLTYSETFYGCKNIEKITLTKGTGTMQSYTTDNSGGNTTYYGATPWYKSRNAIKEIVIEDGVKNVGSYAFKDCVGLKEITIPASISISSSGFEGCTNIEKITVTKGTGTMSSSLSWLANKECLKEVIVEDGVTNINSAFNGCTELVNVTVGNSVTNIKDSTFSGCTSLANIVVSSDNPNYSTDQYGVLFNKDKTKLVKFPSGKIDTTYIVPDSVTSIGNYAFSSCENLTSIMLPNGVTTIGDYAFNGCVGLTNMTIGDFVTSIGNAAFNGCTNLASFTVSSDNPNYSTDQYGVLFNKGKTLLILYPVGKSEESYIIPDSVTSIGDYAFYECVSLSSITIPSSIKAIGSYAFYGCPGVKTIPGNLENLGKYAFRGCAYLTSMAIPDNVSIIESEEFFGCTSLTSVIIGDNVTSIGSYAFYNCTNIKELTIPASAKIYNSANTFYNCTNIEKVTFTKGTGTMQSYSTSSSSNLTFYQYTPWYISRNTIKEVVIEDGVVNIGACAFYECSGLKNVVIGNDVKSIGSKAFYACGDMKELIIPATAFIYNSTDTFRYCSNIKKITLTKGTGTMQNYGTSTSTSSTVTNYQYTPWYKSAYTIEDIVIENGVTNIGDYAFYKCTGLTSITIPKSVASIGAQSFYKCTGLTSINIPQGVNRIGIQAFWECTELTTVSIPDSITNIETCAFDGCTNISDAYYTGTPEQWAEVSIGSDNKYLTKAVNAHSWDKPTWSWDGYESASADFGTCKSGGAHQAVKQATITSEYSPATCTTDEINTYTATVEVVGSPQTYTDTKFEVLSPKLGHIYGEPTWTWNGYTRATAKFVCERNTSHIENVNATITSVTTAPTCTEKGETIYTATVTFEGETYTVTKTQVLAATGHSYASSVWVWSDDFSSATVTVTCSNNSEHVETAEAEITKVTVKDSACLVSGTNRYTAKATIDGKVFGSSKDESLSAIGHNYGEPVWTWDGYTDATAKFVCSNDNTHIENIVAAITSVTTDPTCTEDGKTVYTATVTFEEKTYTNTKTEILPATGHTEVVDKAAAPTCTETGVTEGKHCSVCEDVLVAQQVIDALGHTEVIDKAVAPTCTETGLTEGSHCSACNEVLVMQNSVPAKGHTFGEWYVSQEANIYASGKMQRKCSVCNTTEEKSYTMEPIPFAIRNPSTTTINYGDSIILHADVDLTAGARVIWEADNGNFSKSVSADGKTCTISPNSNGDTIFTAKVVDANGKLLAEPDTQKMTSNAGFFQKLIAFFKKLFGATKVIPQAFKAVF